MMPLLSQGTRQATAGVSALFALLTLAACGGGEADPGPQPLAQSATPSPVGQSPDSASTPTPSASESSASDSATPSAAPTAIKESRLERRPEVVAVRTFATEVAKSLNQGDGRLTQAVDVMTEDATGTMPGVFEEELGNIYPGPVPFTPTKVTRDGAETRVRACLWASGFSIDPATSEPAGAKQIMPVDFVLVNESGNWLVDGLESVTGQASMCDEVQVLGVEW